MMYRGPFLRVKNLIVISISLPKYILYQDLLRTHHSNSYVQDLVSNSDLHHDLVS